MMKAILIAVAITLGAAPVRAQAWLPAAGEGAVGGLHAVAHALPIGLRHEARKRRKASDAQHDEVALFAGRHFQARQGRGARAFLGEVGFFQEQRLEPLAAVGWDECHGPLDPGARRGDKPRPLMAR